MHQGEESSAVAGEMHHTVVSHHHIHSRTKSPSHGLSKRERSRSRGRKHQSLPTNINKLLRESSFGNCNASSRFSGETNASLGSSSFRRNQYESIAKTNRGGPSINELGRCVRHPQMELCCRDSAASPWRILLQECPLCSLDLSKLHKPPEGDKVILDGASSSQPSTSTTNRTSTEEESSVKSWTMSDVSSVDKESKYNNSGAPSSSSTRGSEPQLMRRTPPPPPPRGVPTKHAFDTTLGYPSMESSFSYNQKTVSNPIQVLKELGRKLVIESESVAGGGAEGTDSSNYVQLPIEVLPNRPPPPPFVCSGQNASSNVNSPENNANSRSQMKKQHQKGSIMRTSSRRASPAASGGVDASNESILVEASDIIARMESLMQGVATKSNRSKTKSSHTKSQRDIEGGDDSVERKAAEKLARVQRRKERALRNTAKIKEQEQQRRLHYDGVGLEAAQPMIDPTSSTTRRGRDGPRASDILLEAAQVRDRARRSASRSRERLKAAAIFCGESPLIDNDDWQGQLDDNHESFATEKRRSVLNPHGLEDRPSPPAIERRSQSRERDWRSSGRRTTVVAGDILHDSHEEPVTEGERQHGSIGRKRAESLTRTPNQPSTAEELMSRRRGMRQKIVEMKSGAQSRTDQRRTLGTEQTEEYYPSNDEEEWARSSGDIESTTRDRPIERRRGRSRSSVRDGYSRIRSSSLNVFRKKGVKETDGEDEVRTVDSGKLSIASSLKNMISRYRPRSLSASHRGRNNRSDATGSWLTDSGNSTVGN